MSGNTILKLVSEGNRRSPNAGHPDSLLPPQILADLLEHLGRVSTIPSRDRLMLKAAILLAFFWRVSELTVLAYHISHQFLARWDIQFFGHQLKVFLTHSKTDQFGQGSVITVGCSEDACCPVSAMQHYLESCTTPPSRSLFHFRNGRPLTAKKFRAILHFHLKSLGFNPSLFNTHSCHCCCQGWHVILHHHGTRAAGAVLPSTPTSIIIRPTPPLLLRWQRPTN